MCGITASGVSMLFSRKIEPIALDIGSTYIKLVQLQTELEEEEPRDITVTWVEPKSGE